MDGFKRRLNESVQLRLSIALSLAILAVAIVAGVFAFASAFDEALEIQDNSLRHVAALFERQHMTLRYPEEVISTKGDDEESRIVVQYLADGSKARGDSDTTLPLPLSTHLADGLSTQSLYGESFRVLVKTTAAGERIAVAQETGSRDKDARESAWRSLLPLLVLFPILLLVVADLVRKLFRPIARLAAEIDQRDEQQLHPVNESALPTEVRPFVHAINRLLGRVGNSLETQRRFVADAAHELRSPLTALSLQAERLGAADMSDVARERLAQLRRGLERSKNLVDQLLSLARAQAPATQPASATSVHQVYRSVLEDLLPLARAKDLDIGLESGEDAHLPVSEMDLSTMLKNLVDNAIRYTPQGGRIDLAVLRGPQAVVLRVSDTGPGIAEAERQRVFDPFYRTLGNTEIGSGLGLSIVRAIAERLGAVVELGYTDAKAKTGLSVTLSFALAAD
ncbi:MULTISPECIES: ATP-binding protein [Pseudomonas]|uniref:ATP-binding protein n=1 Tax=Pseudomonas nitroreducens TaxID=46680 RepID=UPI001E321C92|nr:MULTISPECIES: ATP-binding protein [Pseudomonas]MCE4073477.1 ATP-binding protein [Pseudomonas nitritireducens]MCE4082731.1 ATP-binding protein [Pseudomonas nitroreducens]